VEINQIGNHSASVFVTEAELVLLNNALNELLNGVDISDFDTRLGTSRKDAEELLHQIGSLLSKVK
jgi:hypothetical protein